MRAWRQAQRGRPPLGLYTILEKDFNGGAEGLGIDSRIAVQVALDSFEEAGGDGCAAEVQAVLAPHHLESDMSHSVRDMSPFLAPATRALTRLFPLSPSASTLGARPGHHIAAGIHRALPPLLMNVEHPEGRPGDLLEGRSSQL